MGNTKLIQKLVPENKKGLIEMDHHVSDDTRRVQRSKYISLDQALDKVEILKFVG